MNRQLIGEPGVSAFLRSVIQNMGNITWMKPNYAIYLYHNPTQDLEKLKKKLVFFQGLVVDGEAKRLADLDVDQWMDDLNDLIYDVEDILDDVRSLSMDQVCFNDLKSFSDDIKNRFEKILARAKKLGKKAKKLELKRSIEPNFWAGSKVTLRTRETSSKVDISDIHGREDDKAVIVKRLLEVDAKGKRNYDVVGIWGMGGLGKTTLAQLVFNDPEVVQHFQVRTWVCISDVFDVNRATKGLIGDSSSTGDAESLEHLHERLQKIVENKRFLFVLDDVWSSTEWDTVKPTFASCQNGSKILVTTRDSNIAHVLGDKKPYQLKGLLQEQCMSLLKDKALGNAHIDEGEEERLMIWGEKIVSACKGVPLGVKVIGSMLQGAEEEKWRAVSEKANLWDRADIKDGIHPAIRLSYHYLPASLKRCFEYLAIFPADYLLVKEDVVHLWIADGLVEEEEGRRVEDIGNEYYCILKARSLIQENNMMHDIVHHLATVLSRKFCYKENSKEPRASVRHAFVVRLNEMHYEFLAQAPCLRTLIVDAPENVLLNKIRSCKMLRTLNIGGNYVAFKKWTLSIGESLIDHLTHIRYLRIGWSDVRHVSDSIRMLNNMQFLDISQNSQLENLPDRMNHLSNLRHLILDLTSISSLPESICDLNQLQVLSMVHCRCMKQLPKDIGNLRSLRTLDLTETSMSSLPESICALCQLQLLNLGYCYSLERLPRAIGNLRSLKELNLTKTSISSLPESICALFQLQILNLTNCRSLIQLPKDIGNLRSIRTLNLSESSLSSLPDSICALTQLQVLNLGHCLSLEQLPKDIGNLRSLKKLDLSKTSFSSVPESICALCQLQVLNLKECCSLQELPKDIGNLRSLSTLDLSSSSISSLPESIFTLSQLQILNLTNCRSLIQLPRDIGNLSSRWIKASTYYADAVSPFLSTGFLTKLANQLVVKDRCSEGHGRLAPLLSSPSTSCTASERPSFHSHFFF